MGYDASPQVDQTPATQAPERLLMKGAEAIAESAIRAGCKNFFGYPITPQNEIPEYMSARLPEVGGTFVQAESEVASINMLYGAGSAGVRCMTSSSSPGLSLMAEGFSYLIGSEVPAVVVNIMRGGPGLGNIAPSQGDYLQMTRGFGHGDQKAIVLAPASVQEAVDLMSLAFDLSEKYRNPVVVIGDGLIGQMMEPVTFPPTVQSTTEKPWATTGKPTTRKRNIINSLYLDAETLEKHVLHLFEKFARMEAEEQRAELYLTEDQPEIVVCAFGTTARIAKSAMKVLRAQGIRVGLFRPISAWPFPERAFQTLVEPTAAFISIEMSMGQLVQDIRTLVAGRKPVEFWGRTGGVVPTSEEMVEQIQKLHEKLAAKR